MNATTQNTENVIASQKKMEFKKGIDVLEKSTYKKRSNINKTKLEPFYNTGSSNPNEKPITPITNDEDDFLNSDNHKDDKKVPSSPVQDPNESKEIIEDPDFHEDDEEFISRFEPYFPYESHQFI